MNTVKPDATQDELARALAAYVTKRWTQTASALVVAVIAGAGSSYSVRLVDPPGYSRWSRDDAIASHKELEKEFSDRLHLLEIRLDAMALECDKRGNDIEKLANRALHNDENCMTNMKDLKDEFHIFKREYYRQHFNKNVMQ